jgi:DNA-binding transcriptional LysR family regulator
MSKPFSVREVEAFAAVMRHGTVTKAADFLDISQPGVSKLLAQFEAKAGFVVFHRQKQRLIPTPEALTLFEEVERTFVSVLGISRVARDIRDQRTGRLRVGVLPALGSGLIPQILTDFLARHPGVTATVNIRATQTLVEWAGRNQLDLAIGVTTQIDNPGVLRRQLPTVQVVCVMAEDHPLARGSRITLEDLHDLPIVSLLPSDPLSAQIEQLASMRNIRIQANIETNLASAAIAFAALGKGITIVDYLSTLSPKWPGVVVRPLEPRFGIGYSIYRQRGGNPSNVAAEFMETLVSEITDTIHLIDI